MLTARSVEICASLGVGDGLAKVSPAFESWRSFRYCDFLDGSDLAVADHGSRRAWANLTKESSARVAHVSQPRFEAVLRDAVEGLPSVECRFGSKATRVDLSSEGALATLDDGSEIFARRFVACDGFSGVGRVAAARAAAQGRPRAALEAGRVPGISHRDEAPALQHFVSVAFESRSLAERLRAQGRESMLYFVFNRETVSVVVAHDLALGTFNLQFPFFPPAERPGDAAAPRNVRRELDALCAGAPLEDLRIRSARPWLMRARLEQGGTRVMFFSPFSRGSPVISLESPGLQPPRLPTHMSWTESSSLVSRSLEGWTLFSLLT